MPKEDLYSSEIPSKHCQMTGKCMSPGMEGCILDAESPHLVLESRLERINIDLVAISLGEDPVGLRPTREVRCFSTQMGIDPLD